MSTTDLLHVFQLTLADIRTDKLIKNREEMGRLSIVIGKPFYVQCLFNCSVLVSSPLYRQFPPLIVRYSSVYL